MAVSACSPPPSVFTVLVWRLCVFMGSLVFCADCVCRGTGVAYSLARFDGGLTTERLSCPQLSACRLINSTPFVATTESLIVSATECSFEHK